MNKDAEDFIKSHRSISGIPVNGESIIRAAMEWAYRDAAELCNIHADSLTEFSRAQHVAKFLAKTIEARLK